jgi:hypothetical protein
VISRRTALPAGDRGRAGRVDAAMLLLAIVLVLTPPTHREAEGVLAVAEPETVAAATPRAKAALVIYDLQPEEELIDLLCSFCKRDERGWLVRLRRHFVAEMMLLARDIDR